MMKEEYVYEKGLWNVPVCVCEVAELKSDLHRVNRAWERNKALRKTSVYMVIKDVNVFTVNISTWHMKSGITRWKVDPL